MATVREHLASSRVVTLVGPGGVGKTRVAICTAEESRRNFRHGCWVVPLAEIAAPELVASTVADALGLQSADRSWHVDTLADFLAERTALLVLDNCEHLLAAVSDLVQGLRATCPNVRFLLTSRRPLRLSGEDVVVVPPLGLPEQGSVTTPESVLHYEAVDLFVERARSARSDFQLTQRNAPAVVTLCRELDGIPLAIELAAARIRTLTPQEICDSLTGRLQVLTVGYRDADDRHQSLRACVAWSYELCTAAEQRFWARSSVFAGGFDLTAATAVCSGDDFSGDDILHLVSALVDQSVILAEEATDGRTRYRMLTDIRQFGLERAETDGELEGMRERQATWCGALVARFHDEVCGPRQPEWLQLLRRERANLRTALTYFAGAADGATDGLLMARRLDVYWSASGLLDEARHWLGLTLGSGAGASHERAVALGVAARFAVLQNDRLDGRRLIEEGTSIATAVGDSQALGLLLLPDAMLSAWDGATVVAAEQADTAVTLLQDASNLPGELLALFVSGVCHGFAGHPVEAVARHRQCITLADEHGERHLKALAVAGLGEQELAAGRLDEATSLFGAAVVVKQELGDRMGIAVGLDSLGRVAVAQGRGERAALLLGAAEGIWDTVGMSETGNPFAFAPSRSDGLRQARALLGKRRFRELFRRGTLLGIEEVVPYALEATVDATLPSTPPEPSPLTRRELEVADLVADGLSNPDIAARLFISVRTAQGHVENILRKLGFTSRTRIAAWVTERRLAGQAQTAGTQRARDRAPAAAPIPAP